MEKQVKLGRLIKQHMINEVSSHLKDSNCIFITECGKLTSKELEDLRKRLRKISNDYLVVKNSICKRAFKELGINGMEPFINGACGLSFGKDDPVLSSKVLIDFVKENQKLELKGAFIEGEAVSEKTVKDLANVPPREVLLARLVYSINSPVSGMVTTLAGVLRKLMYAINAIKDKKQEQGGSKNG